MIDIRKLKELIRLMVTNDLTELDLRDEQEQVTLRRPGTQPVVQAAPMVAAPAPVAAAPAAPAPAASAPAAPGVAARRPIPTKNWSRSKSHGRHVLFLTSPTSPPSWPLVTTLDRDRDLPGGSDEDLQRDQGRTNGTIEKILVNSDAVEFGQPLFLVRPV